jgi:hypothetical protein
LVDRAFAASGDLGANVEMATGDMNDLAEVLKRA